MDSSSSHSFTSLEKYSAVSSCADYLQLKLRSANTISFHSFMETALYHQDHGYYSDLTPKVGKDGDFITSVSIGCTFGEILSHRLLEIWHDLGKPEEFAIIEMGADRGHLAHDICEQLSRLSKQCNWHYYIIEPIKKLQLAQQEKLKKFGDRMSVHSSIDELDALEGVFLSNELIDAFPVEIIRLHQNQWQQLFIEANEGVFQKTWKQPQGSELQSFTSFLGTDFQENYTTEYRPGLDAFFSAIAAKLTRGLILSIDYGFPRSHYYDPNRTEGTLQTYREHKRGTNPLESVGEQDITTHVDFTQLANTQIKYGFEVHDFTSQARYLTHHGKFWLLQLEQNFNTESLSAIQQFQTLTHPDFLGAKFHALETTKGFTISSPAITNQPKQVLEIS